MTQSIPLFKSVKDHTKPRRYSISDLYKRVISNELKESTARVQEHYLTYEKTKDKAPYRKAKATELEIAMISASEATGKDAKSIKAHNGLYLLDFDTQDNLDIDFDDLFNQLLKEPGLVFIKRTPSGGIHSVFSIETDLKPVKGARDLQHLKTQHKKNFVWLASKIKDKYGALPDFSAGSNIASKMFVSHDPKAQYLPEYQTLKCQDSDPNWLQELDRIERKTLYRPRPKEHIIAALNYVSSDVPRDEWIPLLLAARHGLQHEEDEGRSVIEEWSRKSSRYDPEDFDRTWNSTHALRQDGNNVTVGTLLHHAKKEGYKLPDYPEECDERLVEISYERLSAKNRCDIYYDRNKGLFFHKDARGDYFGEHLTGMRASLKQAGLLPDEINALLDYVKHHNNFDWCGEVAGYSSGLHQCGSKRILVPTGVNLVAPVEGDFNLIKGIISNLLGEEQIPYFYSWLSLTLTALHSNNWTPLQAAAFVGLQGTGKSILLEHIICPMIGGRMADPSLYLRGETPFNADLVQAELLICSDASGDFSTKSRAKIGAEIKRQVGNGYVEAHAKGRDKVNIRNFQLLTFAINESDNSISILPDPREEGVGDKFHLFKCFKHNMPMPTATPDEKAKFRKALLAQLPQFTHFLLNWVIPSELICNRYGVKTYHNEVILDMLIDLSSSNDCFDLILHGLFDGNDNDQEQGSANELYAVIASRLTMEKCRLFKLNVPSAKSLGKQLGLIAQTKNGQEWVSKKRGNSGNQWTILRPGWLPVKLP